jgi:cephalosporin-C deacetylase
MVIIHCQQQSEERNMFVDLPLAELQAYRPELPEPADFDQFWAASLAEAATHKLAPSFEPITAGLTHADVYDVRFSGWGGQRIAAWLYLPRQRTGRLPCVVQYIGYSGGRGLAHQHLLWSAAGYAHLVVDTRGQGSSLTGTGDTPDTPGQIGPHRAGFMTMGIESPLTYYYRRLFVDAVRAVEVAREHPAIDGERVIVAGGSQGGGITLAVAGLTPGLAAAMPDVPFLCDFRRATQITDTLPYREIAQFCSAHRDEVPTVFQTLSYFDGVHFAARAAAPALFSVSLMDEVCPPSTVFAAYNAYAGPKDIRVYEYNGHEGGGGFHEREQLDYAARVSA